MYGIMNQWVCFRAWKPDGHLLDNRTPCWKIGYDGAIKTSDAASILMWLERKEDKVHDFVARCTAYMPQDNVINVYDTKGKEKDTWKNFLCDTNGAWIQNRF